MEKKDKTVMQLLIDSIALMAEVVQLNNSSIPIWKSSIRGSVNTFVIAWMKRVLNMKRLGSEMKSGSANIENRPDMRFLNVKSGKLVVLSDEQTFM